MVDIVNRADWGARTPTSINRTTWAQRVGVAVHYSGGSPTSTPRDLQNYAMDQLGYSDGHYNFLVDRDGVAYEGRGWLVVAAHAAGQNTAWVGVCFIGRDPDVTDAAKTTIRALYDEANRLAGRTLQYSGHGQLPGQNTDCPGANLRAWVAAGMPYPEGDDEMTPHEHALLEDMAWRMDAFAAGSDTIRGGTYQGDSFQPVIQANRVEATLADLAAQVANLQLTLTDAQLAHLADLIAARVPVAPSVEEIAVAVAEEDHRRTAE